MSESSTNAIVELNDLRHVIDDCEILNLPRWHVKTGDHHLILGPSGSGKTTLLHLLAGFRSPTSGTINIAGQSLDELTATRLDRFRGQHIGMVFQSLHLLASLNVRDNLRLAPYLAGLPQDKQALQEILHSLGIADKVLRRPEALSHGEAQRVAIARAVMNRPQLILADEPTSALDDHSCEQVIDLLLAQAQSCAATLLIATHDARLRSRFAQRLELAQR